MFSSGFMGGYTTVGVCLINSTQSVCLCRKKAVETILLGSDCIVLLMFKNRVLS